MDELKRPSDGSKPYSYRYIGALCPDFHRVLLYGGIWLYPPDVSKPQGAARLLYEVAPMSYLAEQVRCHVHCPSPSPLPRPPRSLPTHKRADRVLWRDTHTHT
jgi:fructose-1,6-bisphosphatase